MPALGAALDDAAAERAVVERAERDLDGGDRGELERLVELARLTFDERRRAARAPRRRAARARAPTCATASADRAHGAGRGRSGGRRARRGSPRSRRGSPSRGRPGSSRRRSASCRPSSRSARVASAPPRGGRRAALVVAELARRRPYARAVSNTVTPASAAAAIVSSARSSSRSSSVDRRMQPRPMRSSDDGFTWGTLRLGPPLEGRLVCAVLSRRLPARGPVRRAAPHPGPTGRGCPPRSTCSSWAPVRPGWCWPLSWRSSRGSRRGRGAQDGPIQLGQADGVACRTVEMFEAFGFGDDWSPRPTG